jgi:hypothetical protein
VRIQALITAPTDAVMSLAKRGVDANCDLNLTITAFGAGALSVAAYLDLGGAGRSPFLGFRRRLRASAAVGRDGSCGLGVRRPRQKYQNSLGQKNSTACRLLNDVEQRRIAGWYQRLQNFKQDRDTYNKRTGSAEAAGEKKSEQKAQYTVGAKAFDQHDPVGFVVADQLRPSRQLDQRGIDDQAEADCRRGYELFLAHGLI